MNLCIPLEDAADATRLAASMAHWEAGLIMTSSSSLGDAGRLADSVAAVCRYDGARSLFAEHCLPVLEWLSTRALSYHSLQQSQLQPPSLLAQDENAIALIHILRAFANLCFNHEANRDLILTLSPPILPSLSSLLNPLLSSPKLNKTACGALLNISMDNELVQIELIKAGAIPHLLDIMETVSSPSSPDTPFGKYELAIAAIRLLSSLCESDQSTAYLTDTSDTTTATATNSSFNGQKTLSSSQPKNNTTITSYSSSACFPGLARIVHLIAAHHQKLLSITMTKYGEEEKEEIAQELELIEALVLVLEAIGERELIQRAFFTQFLVRPLIEFVSRVPPSVFITTKSDTTTTKKIDQDDDDDEEEEDHEEAATYEGIRVKVAKLVTLVTMHDGNMREIIHDDIFVQSLVAWLSAGISGGKGGDGVVLLAGDDEVRMAGALAIGNLARSDETCQALVQTRHHVLTPLQTLVHHETQRLRLSAFCVPIPLDKQPQQQNMEDEIRKQMRETCKSIVQVLHAVLGALKNLSLAACNRTFMGTAGLIETIGALMAQASFTSNDNNNNNNASSQGDSNGDDDESSVAAAATAGGNALKQIVFGCVGIIKNLCAGNNEANTYRMITGHALVPPTTSLSTVTSILSPPPSSSFPASTNIPSGYTSLDILVRVLWKSTGDGDTGVRSEGGRAVSNLVRSAYHGKAHVLVKRVVESNTVPLLIQIITGATVTSSSKGGTESSSSTSINAANTTEDDHQHHSPHSQPSGPQHGILHLPESSSSSSTHYHQHHSASYHAHFDAVAVDTRVFPLVQNEGIVALIMMCIAYPETAYSIVRFQASLLPTLVRIVKGVGSSNSSDVVLMEQGEDDSGSNEGGKKQEQQQQQAYAAESRVNACVLLETLSRADPGFRILVKGVLSPIAVSPSSLNATASAASVPVPGSGSLPEALERLSRVLEE